MKSLTSIIVDDEAKARNLLEKLVIEISTIMVLGKYPNVDQAYEACLLLKPDIVFLDVEMPNKNGFELVKLLKETELKPNIVFITAYDKFAVQAFRCAAFDYLLKPIEKDLLFQTLQRLAKNHEDVNFNAKVDVLFTELQGKNRIKLNTREGYILINPEDIIHCKADGSYTEIHLTNGSKEISTFNLGKIGEFLVATNFFRISRSAIINLNYLKEVNRKKKSCILLHDGKEIVMDIPKKQIKVLENYN